MDTLLPTLYLSHGSPMTALQPGAAGAFFQRLGPALERCFGRPRALVLVGMIREPVLLAGAQHQAVHDFGGFLDELYTLRYDAPGAPELARHVQDLLQAADVLEEGDGSLGVAARTLALRVAYAGDRAAGRLSGPRRDRSRQPH